MEYMLLIHGDESDSSKAPAYGEPGFEEFMGSWMAYNQKLIDGGHWVSGASLQPSVTATTIRRDATGEHLLDGPFAETKEHLGGYYLVAAADLDEALQLARSMPVSSGSVEVRPVSFRPDAA